MQNWQKKIFDGMTMIKEGCTASPSPDCKKCPFLEYCYAEDLSDAPTSWQVVEPLDSKKYEVTLEYKVVIDDAPTEAMAITKAIFQLNDNDFSRPNKTAAKLLME